MLLTPHTLKVRKSQRIILDRISIGFFTVLYQLKNKYSFYQAQIVLYNACLILNGGKERETFCLWVLLRIINKQMSLHLKIHLRLGSRM